MGVDTVKYTKLSERSSAQKLVMLKLKITTSSINRLPSNYQETLKQSP